MILVAVVMAHLHFNVDSTILDATRPCFEKFKDTPQGSSDILRVRFVVNIAAQEMKVKWLTS